MRVRLGVFGLAVSKAYVSGGDKRAKVSSVCADNVQLNRAVESAAFELIRVCVSVLCFSFVVKGLYSV